MEDKSKGNLTKDFSSTFRNEISNKLQQEIFPKIKEQLNLIGGVLMIKCPSCKDLKRITSFKPDIEYGFLCSICSQNFNSMRNKPYYKRENDKKNS